MSVADDIKAKIDIVAFVGETTPLKKAGRNFSAACPFHSERTPSFFVFPDRQTWRCFGACATGGDIFSFVMRREGLGFGEALRLLAARAGVPLADPRLSGEQARRSERLKAINRSAAILFHRTLLEAPEAQPARDHLQHRGLDDATIEEFRLGYCPVSRAVLERHLAAEGFTPEELDAAGLVRRRDDGSAYTLFRGRLMIPIQDERSDYLGFGARALDDSNPKYLNSPQSELFEKGAVLYAIHRARDAIREAGCAVIVEGYMDALAAHQHGYRNVVASMGTALTERQVASLTRLAGRFYLALDPDAAGDEATLRSLESSWRILDRNPRGYAGPAPSAGLTAPETRPVPELLVMDLPRGKDPDELIREDPAAWERHIAGATPVIDYVFAAVVARFDASTAQGKTTITRRLAPLIHNAESVFEQNERIAKLARMLKEGENVIRLAVGGLRGAKQGPRRGGPDLQAGSQVLSQPPRDLLEEYCLATLLHYPELLPQASDLEPEDFLKAQNREVFKALARAVPAESLKDQLDPAMHPDLDALFTLPLVPAPHWEREEALRDYVRRLQKRRVDMGLEALQARYATGDISAEEAGAQAEVLIAERCRIDGVSPAGEIRPATGS